MSNMARHRIHALDLANGTEKTGWPINVENVTNAEAGAFKPANQNQRAALALVGGRLIVRVQRPHRRRRRLPRLGGRRLDDDADRHRVVGDARGVRRHLGHQRHRRRRGRRSSSRPGTPRRARAVASRRRPPTATARRSTSWEPAWRGRPRRRDFFCPSNWSSLDSSDTDISGSGVQLFDVPGATPSALVLVLGKDGNAYLLNRTNMGGMSASPVRTLQGGERDDHPGAGRVHDGDGDVLRVQGWRHGLPDRDVRRPDGGQGQRGVAAGDDAGLVRRTDQREQPDGQHEPTPRAPTRSSGSSAPTASFTRSTRTPARVSSAAPPSRSGRSRGTSRRSSRTAA